MNFPRLIYYGPPTEDALVKRVGTPADLDRWLAAGWRLTRHVAVETEIEPTSDQNANAAENVDQAPTLRTDGPTLAEYVAAGYKAENYPPQGYAPVEDVAELPTTNVTDPTSVVITSDSTTDPAPPAAVADAPRPEDTEPIKASNRKKR